MGRNEVLRLLDSHGSGSEAGLGSGGEVQNQAEVHCSIPHRMLRRVGLPEYKIHPVGHGGLQAKGSGAQHRQERSDSHRPKLLLHIRSSLLMFLMTEPYLIVSCAQHSRSSVDDVAHILVLHLELLLPVEED